MNYGRLGTCGLPREARQPHLRKSRSGDWKREKLPLAKEAGGQSQRGCLRQMCCGSLEHQTGETIRVV
eukprot:13818649-Heterocapsa_arctica.AAC.1